MIQSSRVVISPSHAAANAFYRNLISAKELFWFGTDAIEPKTLAAYQKSEKNTTTAHSNVAWASQTGNGLLFIGDKKAPTGVINLVSFIARHKLSGQRI